METALYETLVDLIPEDLFHKAIQAVNRDRVFPGFRKGKTPIFRIQSLARSSKPLQKSICSHIALACFPEQKQDDILSCAFDITDEKLFGYLAAYIAEDREVEFPYSVTALREQFGLDDTIEEIATDEEAYEAGYQTGTVVESINDVNNTPVTVTNEQSDVSTLQIDMSSQILAFNSQTSSETHRSIGTEATLAKTKNAVKVRGAKIHYLGNVQVVPSEYGSFSFYNFFPVAIVESNGQLRMLDYYERRELFPEKGNINIFSPSRNDGHMAELFRHGDIFVIDITDDLLIENRKANNELNITNNKVDIVALEARQAIHEPEEFGLYPIIDYPDVENALAEDRLIRFTQQEVDGRFDEYVMLRLGSRDLIGPFMLVPDPTNNTYYINPQSKKKNYLFTVYHGQANGDCFFILQRSEGAYYGAAVQDIQYINTNDLPCEQVDFIPKEALVQELSTILTAQDGDEAGKVIESAFAGIELPNGVAEARRQRLVSMFEQITDLDNAVGTISVAINNLLLHAASEDRGRFDSIFRMLAEDPKFMLRIQRYRRIAEAIEDKETELAQLSVDIEETLRRKDETEQQLESKQSAILTEDIRTKQDELARVEGLLAERLKALKLVDEIQQLQVEKGVQEALLKRAKDEYDDIHAQTQTILDTFRNDVKEPMAQIAHVVLNSEIESIVSAAADQAMQRKKVATDRLANLLVHKLMACCDRDICADNVIDIVCGRIAMHRSYNKNEIVNLLICLTQGFLTVFSGAPGTGKTSVCAIIAHALGLDHSVSVELTSDEQQEPIQHTLDRYVIVPVERGWSSKKDFVGYYNPLTKSFDKANSAIYQALEVSDIEAKLKDNPCVPPSVIMLDEANLSPMEYYWADFMGVCDDCKTSVITLSEQDRFKVAKSLRFMATINNDHTTENLSPRLIDRAWVISLPQPNSPRITHFDEYYSPIPMETLRKVFDVEGDSIALDSVSESILREIFEVCRDKLNANVSPRAELAIRKYCKVGSGLFESSKSGVDGPIVAIDYAVAQKILPKVQGSGSAYRKKLEEFNEALMRNNLLKSSELLNRIIQRGDRNMQYYQYFA